MPPSATPPLATLSSRPRTAIRLRFGVVRWTRVNPATSRTELLRPTIVMATRATTTVGTNPMTAIGSPPAREREQERRAEALATGQQDRDDRPEQASQPHHRVQGPDAGFAERQQLDRSDHHEHGQEAAHERLGAKVEDDEARAGQGGDRPDPGRDLVERGGDRRCGSSDRRDRQPRDRRHPEGVDRDDREDDRGRVRPGSAGDRRPPARRRSRGLPSRSTRRWPRRAATASARSPAAGPCAAGASRRRSPPRGPRPRGRRRTAGPRPPRRTRRRPSAPGTHSSCAGRPPAASGPSAGR